MDVTAKPGMHFTDRIELAKEGIHRQRQAGIAWTIAERAYSIVLSGGYEDDEDYGDVIIYTGEGGRDSKSKHQIADQTLTKGNLALVQSKLESRLIYVTRGYRHRSPFSPSSGYLYAGTYIIEDYWKERGQSGYFVYRFRLVAASTYPRESQVAELPSAERRNYQTERIIRDTKQSLSVKKLYDYACQVCNLQIDLPLDLKYAEGAHIRPLGRPHNGPDHLSNLLCLCPNHHVMFDNYVFSVDPKSYKLVGDLSGDLILRDGHDINVEHFRYHNQLYNIRNDCL